MRDGRRVWHAALLGGLLAAVLGVFLWATGSDATTGLIVAASGWPFLVLAAYLALRSRGDQAVEARGRAGIATDEGWQSLRRTIAGKEVPTDPRVRREAISQLRRSARMVRTFIVVAVLMAGLAIMQTVLAFDSGDPTVAVLAWFVVATGVAQVLLARTHGRRADRLEASADEPPPAPSAI